MVMKYAVITICVALCWWNLAVKSCTSANTRVRKEFRDMSSDEWSRYKRAVQTMYQTGQINEFSNTHLSNVPVAHGNPQFLPWHRVFLWQYENALRRIDPSITVPYWDWSYDGANGDESEIFWEEYLGITPGTPDCNFPVTFPRRHCLLRDYEVSELGPFHDSRVIDGLINDRRSSYDRFRNSLESAPHGTVHVEVGGPSGDMSMMQSPNDPIFFLHHAFVDKIWYDRQQASGNPEQYDGSYRGRRVKLSDILLPFNVDVRSTIYTQGSQARMCFRYQPFSRRNVRAVRTRGLVDGPVESEGYVAPKRIPTQWILMHGLNPDDVREAELYFDELGKSIHGFIQRTFRKEL